MADDEPTADAKGRDRPYAKTGTPIADMAAEDRALVTHTARRTYEIIELTIDRLWDDVVLQKGVPRIPASLANTLLALQRMAAGMLDKHPGLLAEVQGQGTDPEATDDEIERILDAIPSEEG